MKTYTEEEAAKVWTVDTEVGHFRFLADDRDHAADHVACLSGDDNFPAIWGQARYVCATKNHRQTTGFQSIKEDT